MGKLEPTENQPKYYSRYSPEKKISPHQYVIEFICENKAKKDRVDLPTHFWKIPKWEKYYKSQLRACVKLCDRHGHSKVLAFVKERKIYSLFAKWLDEAIGNFQFSEVELSIENEVSRENLGCSGIIKKDKVKDLLKGLD